MSKYAFISLFIFGFFLQSCVKTPVKEEPSSIQSAKFSMQKGIDSYQNSEYQEARSWFERAIWFYESFDDQKNLTKAHLNQAQNLMAYGQDHDALYHIKKADDSLKLYFDPAVELKSQLLKSSYFIRQKQFETAKKILTTYLEKPSKQKDLRRSFLENRLKIAIELQESDVTLWLNQYKKNLNQEDVRDRYSLIRYQTLIELTKNPTLNINKTYSEILSAYRAFADKAHIAELLEEWGTVLIKQQSPLAKNKLERALKVRVMMGDQKGSQRIFKLLLSLKISTKEKEAYTNLLKDL